MNRLFKIYLALFGTWLVLRILDWDWTNSIRFFAFAAFLILSVYYVLVLTRKLIRRLLWRIRRKLIISYIFIGFIPVSLLLILVLLGFFIFMGQATSEMFNSTLDGYTLQTKIESEKLLHLTEFMDPDQAVERWYSELQPEDQKWLASVSITLYTSEGIRFLKGNNHEQMPAWLKGKNFSGLVLREAAPSLASTHYEDENQRALLMIVPLGQGLLDLIKKKTDADIHYVPFSTDQSAQKELQQTLATTKKQPIWPVWWDFPVWWLSLPNQYDWSTGKKLTVFQIKGEENESESLVTINGDEKDGKKAGIETGNKASRIGAFWVSTNVSRVYNHIFARSTSLQKFVYALMLAVGIFFLIIELISFVSGFLLARSITASVHNLFEGTERIKSGDFSYRIKMGAKDQLGELAASFNNMTESIQSLLVERSEKERLAESLRIARQMQQKLLPREVTSIGGVQIATMNIPAQEVCGDYYDIIRRGEHEMAVIIADVSGKGPSAALYMAEVKGVILSLSQRSLMPREVLVELNQLLGPTLDARNFITITCALIDEPGRLMKMSRAGHNPMLHYCAASNTIESVQPKGIGLGMGKNGIFEQALDEVQRNLTPGDILVFYTDGLTEAMNEQNQLYGLNRLSDLILHNRAESTEDIKKAIFQDLHRHLNRNLPQDDITLVLLKIQ